MEMERKRNTELIDRGANMVCPPHTTKNSCGQEIRQYIPVFIVSNSPHITFMLFKNKYLLFHILV